MIVEVPPCPEGHLGRVVRDGWYGAREGQRRQRWRCVPADGTKFHKFLEVLPRLARSKESAHYCPECETRVESWEGHPAPRMYGFAAREIAGALAAVAGGATYRDAAARARTNAGRQLTTHRRTRVTPGRARPTAVEEANRHPQLVSDWVQTYAPALWEYYLGKQVKAGLGGAVLLDATKLVTTKRGQRGGLTAFFVLAVLAYSADGKPFVIAVSAVPSETKAAWVELLATVPFTPSRFVADRGAKADNAAAQVWPDAARYACEWHLRKNLRDQLPVGLAPDHVARQYVDGAMASLEAWEWLGGWLNAEQGADRRWNNIVTIYNRLDALVRNQLATRPTDGPHGAGPAEHLLDALRHQLDGRVGSLTNRTRTDALLLLLATGHNRWVDEPRWAYLLRGWLVKRDGVAPAQRPSVDPEGTPSLRPYTRAPRPQTQGQKGTKKPRVQPPAIEIATEIGAPQDDPWLLPAPS